MRDGYDLMGRGKRMTYKTDKKDETTPGPGKYTNQKYLTIESNTRCNSPKKDWSAVVGCSKDQNNKLQEHGQERIFLGRYGADPGAYNLPKIKSKDFSFSKSPRGLL